MNNVQHGVAGPPPLVRSSLQLFRSAISCTLSTIQKVQKGTVMKYELLRPARDYRIVGKTNEVTRERVLFSQLLYSLISGSGRGS